jgi:hypothetical protein
LDGTTANANDTFRATKSAYNSIRRTSKSTRTKGNQQQQQQQQQRRQSYYPLSSQDDEDNQIAQAVLARRKSSIAPVGGLGGLTVQSQSIDSDEESGPEEELDQAEDQEVNVFNRNSGGNRESKRFPDNNAALHRQLGDIMMRQQQQQQQQQHGGQHGQQHGQQQQQFSAADAVMRQRQSISEDKLLGVGVRKTTAGPGAANSSSTTEMIEQQHNMQQSQMLQKQQLLQQYQQHYQHK